MEKELREHILTTAKACLPGGATNSGVAVSLDLTIFSFINAVPADFLTDDILEETYLRLAKLYASLQKANINLDLKFLSKLLGKEPENPVERTRLVSEKLKQNNNFNSEGKRVGAIVVQDDKITLLISKELSLNTFVGVLKKHGTPVTGLHGACQAWSFHLEKYNLIDFLIPEIEPKYTILGVEQYKEKIASLYTSINPIAITDIVTSHQAPRRIVIGSDDHYFEVLCGAELMKRCAPFVRKLDPTSQNNIFKIDFKFALVIKTMIEIFEEFIYMTRAAKESLEFRLNHNTENPYATIKRGSIPLSRFAVMQLKLSGVYFEINHHPRDPDIVLKMKKAFPKGKFSESKNFHTVSSFKDFVTIRRILLDFSLPIFSEHGEGDNALKAAADYLDNIKDNPKATIKFLAGRGFEIIRFASAKPIERDFNTEDDANVLLNFIAANRPTCDAMTADKLIRIHELGANKVNTKNGRTFEIKALRGTLTERFSYLPSHCVRETSNGITVTILTASHGFGLRETLLKYGFASKKDRDAFLPLLNKQIDRFQHRYDKSYTNSGNIQIPSFLGNSRLEASQRGCVEYGLVDTRFMIGDEPGYGKTWEGLAIVEHEKAYPAIIIVPKIGKLSWSYEFNNLIKDRSSIVLGMKNVAQREQERKAISNVDVVIVNYDMLDEFVDDLCKVKWKSMLVDESHYTKHEDSNRTRNTHKIKDLTVPKVIIPLSGSFWENRPSELIPQLRLVGKLNLFGGEASFVKRYCTSAGKKPGMGASNLDELNEVLRTHCMIRRQKEQGGVAKWRQAYVPVTDLNLTEYKKVESDLAQYIFDQVHDEMVQMIASDSSLVGKEDEITARLIRKRWLNSAAKAKKLVEMSKLRKLIGKAKVDSAKEFIDSILGGEEKLVVFAYHKDVQSALFEHYDKSNIKTVRIISEMNDIQRKEAEAEFLKGDARLIICSIGAASENMNFASSSHVLFVEGREKPMTQALMRIDRKPQKSSILNGWFLRAMGTIDDWLYDLSAEKAADFSKGSGDKTINAIEKMVTEDYATILTRRHFKKIQVEA